MSDTLSQDEVDALLKGMADGEVSVAEEPEAPGTARSYDLLHQERGAVRQFPGLGLVHERLLRRLRQSLAAIIGSSSSVEISTVETTRHATFRNRLEQGSALTLFTMSPLRGQALFAIPPVLVFQMVDRVFGGSGRPPELVPDRELSAIEVQIVRRVTLRFVEDLAEAWAPVERIDCTLLRTDTNPALIALAAADDMVLSVDLRCDLGVGPSKMVLAIPVGMLEPVRSKLGEPRAESSGVDRDWLDAMREAVEKADVELSAELGRREMSTRDVLSLRVGDVIPLDTRRDDNLEVFVEGRYLLAGLAGISRGQNAVRIVSNAGGD